MDDEPILVFVYGTLKRGHGNHHWLEGARYEGEARMAGATLHDLGPFPMAVPGEGELQGELYAVDGEILARLDRLEGVPRLYDRRRMTTREGRCAWVYVGRPRQVRHARRLPDGRWEGPSLRPGDRRPPTGAAEGLPVLAVLLGIWCAGLAALGPGAPSRAADTLALCNRWRSSSGSERIVLGNAIGTAHFLTKNRKLQESPEASPVALYAEADLMRVCR